jgi:transcriptional regulator with XRE-family HTH domain
VNVTEGAIRQMESGQSKSPSFAVGIKLAHALGVTPEYLAFGEDGLTGLAGPKMVQTDSVTVLERRIASVDRRVAILERAENARKSR